MNGCTIYSMYVNKVKNGKGEEEWIVVESGKWLRQQMQMVWEPLYVEQLYGSDDIFWCFCCFITSSSPLSNLILIPI